MLKQKTKQADRSSFVKRLNVIVVLFIVAIGLFLWLNSRSVSNSSVQKSPSTERSTSTRAVTESDRPFLTIGKADAPVSITEFGDYKCPSCASFHQGAEQQITSEYINTGKVKIVFRTYPYLGPDSGRAARSAYCANDQKIFSAYHAAVFDFMWNTYYKDKKYEAEIQNILTDDTLTDLAKSAGAEEAAFKSCIAGDKFNKFIDEDLAAAADSEVQGTPTFLIGNQKIVGPQPYNVFKSLIELQLR